MPRGAARPGARELPFGLSFFATAPKVGCVAPLLQGLTPRLGVVSFIQAHGLRLGGRGCWPLDPECLQLTIDSG